MLKAFHIHYKNVNKVMSTSMQYEMLLCKGDANYYTIDLTEHTRRN